jgi:DnaJ-class molecular chaperone
MEKYIFIMNMTKQKEEIQCGKCEGTGFLKYEMKLCEVCDGIKCIFCNSTGLEKMPYDLCNACYGDGTIHTTKST